MDVQEYDAKNNQSNIYKIHIKKVSPGQSRSVLQENRFISGMRKRQKIVSTSITTQEYNLEGELTKEFNGFPEEFPEELKKLR